MLNPFGQQIGIWYSDRERAEKVFDTMVSWYRDNLSAYRISHMTESIVKNRNEMSIRFKNGDTIRFFPAGERMRGYALTDSFIIGDVNKYIINTVIRSCTKFGGEGVWILDDSNERSMYYSIIHRKKYE